MEDQFCFFRLIGKPFLLSPHGLAVRIQDTVDTGIIAAGLDEHLNFFVGNAVEKAGHKAVNEFALSQIFPLVGNDLHGELQLDGIQRQENVFRGGEANIIIGIASIRDAHCREFHAALVVLVRSQVDALEDISTGDKVIPAQQERTIVIIVETAGEKTVFLGFQVKEEVAFHVQHAPGGCILRLLRHNVNGGGEPVGDFSGEDAHGVILNSGSGSNLLAGGKCELCGRLEGNLTAGLEGDHYLRAHRLRGNHKDIGAGNEGSIHADLFSGSGNGALGNVNGGCCLHALELHALYRVRGDALVVQRNDQTGEAVAKGQMDAGVGGRAFCPGGEQVGRLIGAGGSLVCGNGEGERLQRVCAGVGGIGRGKGGFLGVLLAQGPIQGFLRRKVAVGVGNLDAGGLHGVSDGQDGHVAHVKTGIPGLGVLADGTGEENLFSDGTVRVGRFRELVTGRGCQKRQRGQNQYGFFHIGCVLIIR